MTSTLGIELWFESFMGSKKKTPLFSHKFFGISTPAVEACVPLYIGKLLDTTWSEGEQLPYPQLEPYKELNS